MSICVGGIQHYALIDSCATHNFLRKDVERTWGLQINPIHMSFKVVNFEDKRLIGMIIDVPMKIACWSGNLDFTII